MDLQLLAFVTVAEEQNFTRAAEKLHISQPAISQHIQNLEQRLDAKLLDRTNKSVQLNPAGEVAYHHAKQILNSYQQMHQLIQDLKDEAAGTLRIGASFTFGEYVLPHVIANFRSQYPAITPTIAIENTQHVVESVGAGELDIGIIEGNMFDASRVTVEPFAEDTVVVVASSRHPLARETRHDETQPDVAQPGGRQSGSRQSGLRQRKAARVTVAELAAEPWIIREPGSGTREVTENVFERYGIRPENVVEYGSTQIIKESVEAGLGITILSRWVIRKELQWGTLQELTFTDTPIKRKFSVVLRKSDFHTRAVRLFHAFLHMQTELQGFSVS